MGDSSYSRYDVTVKHNLAQSTLMESSRTNRQVKETRTSVKGRLGAALLWIIEHLAMVPKVWMHNPDIPGLLVVRVVEKHSNKVFMRLGKSRQV